VHIRELSKHAAGAGSSQRSWDVVGRRRRAAVACDSRVLLLAQAPGKSTIRISSLAVCTSLAARVSLVDLERSKMHPTIQSVTYA
jgi:hypothetical protein